MFMFVIVNYIVSLHTKRNECTPVCCMLLKPITYINCTMSHAWSLIWEKVSVLFWHGFACKLCILHHFVLCSQSSGHDCNILYFLFCLLQIRCWEVKESGQTIPKAQQSHTGPILDCCWHDVSGNGRIFLSVFCRVEKSTKQRMGEQEVLWKHLLLDCVSIAVLSFPKLVQLFQSRVLYKRQTECF